MRALILAACLLTITACSSTTFVYNRLDFLLPWYLGDYVELNRAQKDHLDELLQPYLQWHRSDELPRYIDLLDELDVSLNNPLVPEQVAATSEAFEDAWLRLERESLEWMLELGVNLSDEQIEEFLDHLQEQQREYEEKYLTRSDEQFWEDSYDNLVDSFQDYLGKLDSSQKDLLKNTSLKLQRSDAVWLEERALRLQQFAVLLKREPGWQQRVRDTINARSEDQSAQYTEVYEHNAAQIREAVATVLNSRSEKQNRRLRAKLSNLREDLQTLVEQGGSTSS